MEFYVTQGKSQRRADGLLEYLPESNHSCTMVPGKAAYEGHDLPLRVVYARRADGACVTDKGQVVNARVLSATECEGTSVYDRIQQSGRRGAWNEATKRWDGACLFNAVRNGDYSGCITNRFDDAWHTWTINIKAGPWYDQGPFRHGWTVRIWKDADLITEFDPTLVHPRANPPTPAECAAVQTSIVNAAYCLTGYDIQQHPYNGKNPAMSGPRTISDPGGMFGRFHLGMQSWRRADPGSTHLPNGVDPLFYTHAPAIRWFDDVVVARANPGLPEEPTPPAVQPLKIGPLSITGGKPPYRITVRDAAGTVVHRELSH
jgi:hypothetical protein